MSDGKIDKLAKALHFASFTNLSAQYPWEDLSDEMQYDYLLQATRLIKALENEGVTLV